MIARDFIKSNGKTQFCTIKSDQVNMNIENVLQKFICISLLEFHDFKIIWNEMTSLSNNKQNTHNYLSAPSKAC